MIVAGMEKDINQQTIFSALLLNFFFSKTVHACVMFTLSLLSLISLALLLSRWHTKKKPEDISGIGSRHFYPTQSLKYSWKLGRKCPRLCEANVETMDGIGARQYAEGVKSSSTMFHIARLILWLLLLSACIFKLESMFFVCVFTGFSSLGQVCVWLCFSAHVNVRGHLLAPPAHWPSVFWSILCFSLPSYHWGMKRRQMLAPLQLAVLWTLLHTEWSPGLKHDFYFICFYCCLTK